MILPNPVECCVRLMEPAVPKFNLSCILAGGGPGDQTAKYPTRTNVKGTRGTQKPIRDKPKLNGGGDVNLTKSVAQPTVM